MKGASSLTLQPASPHIGADVLYIDVAEVIERNDTAVLDAIQQAIEEHIVLRFRKQKLTPEQMEQLGRHFGPLLSLKRKNNDAAHIQGVDYLKIISNVQQSDGRPLGDGSSAPQDWHTDGAAKPVPAGYTYFYARKVPGVPPKTYWMNAYLIYESLPADMKEKIAHLRVIHHEYPAGNEFPLPPSKSLEERQVGPQHPLVRLHPTTRRPVLFLPHRDDMLVVDMSPDESFSLISRLRRHAAESPYWWTAAMEVDDLVVWDNRSALHKRDGWDQSLERIVWHLANEGEPPIPLPESSRVA
ncbi:TauD/TfdA family dioxygenase [Chelativorans sp. AA-79]|uniref:TauD/TfdA dioxygenase family protein n=1 Tax=Chelativorans sp. AA-79 TaxID=3028735 RepID=UPI0023F97652|nr:TauD/TfdA family dioxygenase [Chelativorans sp. AA-79]WEX07203.1 TauD/TfdA family dioxygenase [Chelativorans sp. AA-79]